MIGLRTLRLEPLEDRRLLALPTILGVAPMANTHAAPAESDVSITFDQAIAPASASDATFAVHAMQSGRLLDPPNTISVSGDTITLNPAQSFHPGELVQATVTTGIENAGAEALASPFVWQFRTAAAGGSGTFADSGQSHYENSSTQGVVLGDLDGDGDLDAFVANGGANEVWLNDGSGLFVDSGQQLGNSNSYGVALGDLDADGDLDAYVATVNGVNRVWLNDGLGVFSDSGQSLGNSGSYSVALGDLDGDGDLDAFVVNGVDSRANRVWLNDGTGTFVDSGQSLGDAVSTSLALGDVDGDGDLDAFVVTGGANEIWLNDGNGFFTVSAQAVGPDDVAVALGDLDGDGDLDAFVVDGGPNTVWLNDGAGTFTDSGQTLGSFSSRGVGLADLDNDGDLDAFVANLRQGNRIWVNDGAALFSDAGQSLGNSASWTVGLGDVDGDGDLDAFIGNLGMGPERANRVWINQDTSISGTVWHDGNADGVKDPGEPGLDAWTVYLDADNNGQLDAGETVQTTSVGGGYVFGQLAPGTYVVREVLQAPWTQSAPATVSYTVTVADLDQVIDRDFGNFRDGSISGTLHKTPQFRVNTTRGNDQFSGDVAMDDDGDYVVAWNMDGTYDVYIQRYNAAGEPQGSEAQVGVATIDDQWAASVAMDADGDFVVAWQSWAHDGSEYGVYAQRYNAAGAAQGSEFLVNTFTTGNQSSPSVAMAADGKFVIAWHSYAQDGSAWGIYARRYNATGVAQGGEFPVNTTTINSQLYPSVAMDTDGDFVVAWHSWAQDGSDYGIYAQRYNAAGAAQGGEFQVNTTTDRGQRGSAVAMDDGGNFVIAWESEGLADDQKDVLAQRYNAAGVAQGTEFQVNPTSNMGQYNAAVAMDADGDFLVTWEDDSSGTSYDAYGQRFNAAGVAQGSELRINAFRGDDTAEWPVVAMDADGDAVVSWTVYDQATGDYDVYAQRFPAGGTGLAAWTVYVDADNNGQLDAGEASTVTDAEGRYTLAGLAPGTHVVREVLQSGWLPAGPSGGFYSVPVRSFEMAAGRHFFHQPLPVDSISGEVFGDANADGVKDLDELGLEARTVYLDADNDGHQDAGEVSTFTNPGGYYVFTQLAPGEHVVRQAVPFGSSLTTPIGGGHRVTLAAGQTLTGYDFGNVGGSEELPVATSADDSNGKVAMDADGDFVVAWEYDYGYGDIDVHAQRFNSTGDAQGDTLWVSFDSFAEKATSVAMDADGDFVVVFQMEMWDWLGNPLDFDIVGLRHNAAGEPIGDILWVAGSSDDEIEPSVAMDDNGNFVVVWQSVDGLYVRRYNAAGSPLGSSFRISGTSSSDAHPLVAMDADGDFVVAWTRLVGMFPNPDYEVYALRYNAAGQAQGTAFRVNVTTTDAQVAGGVAMDAAGNFVVAWEDYGYVGSGSDVYARRYNAAGVALGDEFRVNSTVGFEADAPAVAVNDDGDFLVVWAADTPSSGFDVFAQHYDATGGLVGTESRVNATVTGDQYLPSVAADSDNGYVVVWTSAGQGVFYRLASKPLRGSISGRKFEDLNQNGVEDAGESGLEGWTIYLDSDDDGVLDAGELSINTDAGGDYEFAHLPAGTYVVREVIPQNWTQTLPVAPADSYTVDLGAGVAAAGIDFGNYLPPLEISIDDVSLDEGDSGTTVFSFTATLSYSVNQAVTVDYATADGTATVADGDYAAAGNTLTFDPGQTVQAVQVLVNGDTLVESDETFFVNLSNPTVATIGDPQGLGTITNDDFLVNVTLVPVALPSAPSLPGTSLPAAVGSVILGNTYYLEVWVQDFGIPSFGISGGNVDLHYVTALADATAVFNEDFDVLPSGTIDDPNGLVDNLGGGKFTGGLGVAPNWARLAYVEMVATSLGDVDFQLAPGGSQFSRFGSGNVAWDQVGLGDPATVSQVSAAARVDVTVVRQPTTFDNPATGEVNTLPSDEPWLHEWEPFWAELWVSTPGGAADGIWGGTIDLQYATGVTTAAYIEYGPAFAGSQSGTIDDVSGLVDNVGGTTVRTDVGDDAYALLARIRFEPGASDQAAVDEVGHFLGPYDLGLQLLDDAMATVGLGPVASELGAAPDTDLFAVPYDIDDTDNIGFGDFSFFAPAFGLPVGGGEPPYTWWADFDGSGGVDFGDFSYFAFNFGRSKPDAGIGFPGSYPSYSQVEPAASYERRESLAIGANLAANPKINVELVAATIPTASDTVATLPESLTSVLDGQTYYVEIWVQDIGIPGVGVAGGYVDLGFTASAADVISLNHGNTFDTLTGGSFDNPSGLVDDFGGGTFSASTGVEPNWARLGYIEYTAQGIGQIDFNLGPGAQAFGRWGAGEVDCADVQFGTLSLNQTAPAVLARHVFYDNSHWDGNTAGPNTSGGPTGNGDDGAIAPDKQALLPSQTAAFVNYTSYTRGLNGIMVDVQGLANPAGIDAADFLFRVGNDNAPGGWPAAPAPTSVSVRAGAGEGGSDRVTLIWPDNAIENQWLQVTVLANADTGLVQNDVFYAGNLIGDTDGNFVVNIADLYAAYLAMGPGAAVTSPADIDRSEVVNIADMYAVYLNLNSTLQALTAPAAILQSIDSVFEENPSWAIELMWLDELYGTSDDSEEEEDDPLEATAAHGVSAVYYDE